MLGIGQEPHAFIHLVMESLFDSTYCIWHDGFGLLGAREDNIISISWNCAGSRFHPAYDETIATSGMIRSSAYKVSLANPPQYLIE